MKKTKKYIHHSLCLIAFTLGFGVVTHSAHMKDVTSYALGTAHTTSAAMEAVKKAETVNPHLQGNAKVTAELHNHIEKQTFSSMVKSLSDDTNRQGSRQLKRNAKKMKQQLEEDEYIEPDTASYRELFQRALGLI